MKALKFLDAYQREDVDIFFGRDQEVEELYQKLFAGRLLLLYGLSGTGKTSVVRCGLLNRFDPSDCQELYVRRDQHILVSLKKSIEKVAEGYILPSFTPLEAVQALYIESLRPVFLIFDQFEELFISGDQQEVEAFGHFVKDAIADDRLNVKILLVIREEFVAHMDLLERLIPTIYNNRLRLERMTTAKVQIVISRILESEGIGIAEEAVIPKIVENVQTKAGVVELPYLQVYFFRLLEKLEKDPSSDQLTMEMLKGIGKLEDILGSFLEEQLIEAGTTLHDNEFGWRILKCMITPEATKKVVSRSMLAQGVFLTKPNDEKLRKLESFISLLTRAKILRIVDDDQLEIAHDSLGPEIAKRRTPKEIKILESERIIKSKFRSTASGIKDYLNKAQLEYIKPVKRELNIEPGEREFLVKSARRVRARKLLTNVVILVLFLVSVGWTAYTMRLNKVLQSQKESSHRLAKLAQMESLKSKANAEAAKRLVDMLKIARDQSDVNAREAERNAEEARERSEEARRNEKEARENRDLAVRHKEEAETQARNADSLRQVARIEQKRTEALNLALKSTQLDKGKEKLRLAIQSYFINQEYNSDQWMPELATALLMASEGLALKEVLSVKGAVEDIFRIGNSVFVVTDLGMVMCLTGNDTLTWSDREFFYLNNSWNFDERQHELRLKDKRGYTYRFDLNAGMKFRERSERTKIDSTLVSAGDYCLTSRHVLIRRQSGYEPVVNFGAGQVGTAMAVSQTGGRMAAGTQVGWLYLLDQASDNVPLRFESMKTRIRDIAFDDEGKFIAIAGADSRLQVNSVQLISRQPIEMSFGRAQVNAVCFVGDKQVWVGTSEGKIFLINLDQGYLVSECCKKLGIGANCVWN